MMKRSTVGGVYEVPVVPEPKAPAAGANGTGTGEAAKVIWITDPSALVGPREEEARRKGPEMKFLYAISALLTIMVLWGIFREAHDYVPAMLTGSKALAQEAELVDTSADTFEVDAIDVSGRRRAKHLLEIQPQVPMRERPHKFVYLLNRGEKSMRLPRKRSGGSRMLLRKLYG